MTLLATGAFGAACIMYYLEGGGGGGGQFIDCTRKLIILEPGVLRDMAKENISNPRSAGAGSPTALVATNG